MSEPNTAARIGAPVAQIDQDMDVLTRADVALDVGRPAAVIRAYVLDFARHSEWVQTYLKVEAPTDQEASVGARFRARERQDLRWDKRPFTTIAERPGFDVRTVIEVRAVGEHRIDWRATFEEGDFLRGASIAWTVALEPITSHITCVRLRGQLAAPSALLVGWMDDLRAGGYPFDVLQRQADRSLHNLRAILESGTRRGP